MQPDQCFTLAGSSWITAIGIYQNQLFVCFKNGDCAQYTELTGAQAVNWMNLILGGAVSQNTGKGPGYGTIVNCFIGAWGIQSNFAYQKIACPCATIQAAQLGTTCANAGTLYTGYTASVVPKPGNNVLNLQLPAGLATIKIANDTTALVSGGLAAGTTCGTLTTFSALGLFPNTSQTFPHTFAPGEFCSISMIPLGIPTGTVTISQI